jgi:transglutaminase-like putative cysteine protease
MKLHVSCNLHFQVIEETALILMLRPFRGVGQWISQEVYTIEPGIKIIETTDGFGNYCQRLLAPVGDIFIHTLAEAKVNDTVAIAPGAYFVEIQGLPDEVLTFLLPSRYCESDRFGDIAREITCGALPGYDQASKITAWVRDTIQYVPGSSEFPLSAIEVHQRGTGVCRDLAQLAIALCRSISIPARLVVGYLHKLQPMDLHAWFEAYIGDCWYPFDPTQPDLTAGRVIIAFGRDAADVSIFHQFGLGCHLNKMDVKVDLVDNLTIVNL